MKKTFICVIGPDNSGKSSMIKWLGATLCSSVEPSAIISSSKYVNQKFVEDSGISHSSRTWKLFEQEDVGIVLKVRSHTVGIFSPGDTEDDVNNSIDEANKYGCDIAVVAINTVRVCIGEDLLTEATSKVETTIRERFPKISGTIRIVNSLQSRVDIDWPTNRLTQNGAARYRKDWKLHSLQTMELMSNFLSTIGNAKENN